MNIDHNYDGSKTVSVLRGSHSKLAEMLMEHSKRAANDPNVKSIEQHKDIRPNDICPCGSGKKFKKCHQYA